MTTFICSLAHYLIISSIVIVVIKRRQLRTSAIQQSNVTDTGIRRSYDKQFMTRLFSYRPYIKPSVDNCRRLRLGQLSTFGLDIQADMKTAV